MAAAAIRWLEIVAWVEEAAGTGVPVLLPPDVDEPYLAAAAAAPAVRDDLPDVRARGQLAVTSR